MIERFKSVLGEHVTEVRVQVIERLYENALLIEGLHPNPVTMISRVQALMERAAAAWTE